MAEIARDGVLFEFLNIENAKATPMREPCNHIFQFWVGQHHICSIPCKKNGINVPHNTKRERFVSEETFHAQQQSCTSSLNVSLTEFDRKFGLFRGIGLPERVILARVYRRQSRQVTAIAIDPSFCPCQNRISHVALATASRCTFRQSLGGTSATLRVVLVTGDSTA